MRRSCRHSGRRCAKMEKTETLRRTLVQYKNYAFCRLLKKRVAAF